MAEELELEPVPDVDSHFVVRDHPLTRFELELMLSEVARKMSARVLQKRFRGMEDDQSRLAMIRALNQILVTLSQSMNSSEIAALEKRLDALEGKTPETHRIVIHETESRCLE